MTPPDIPDEFEVRTIVFLLRGDPLPDLSDEALDALQAEHLAYGSSLRARGLTAANGPFTDQTDPRFRGMAIYTVGPDAALELASQDPSVRAGRLKVEVASWWTEAGRIAFPREDTPVGRRLRHEDMD